MVSGDKPGLTALPIEVEVELERARRLGDRFAGSCTEDSELAREQRARRFSAEFLKVPVLAHGLKNGDEIAKLEASLEVTRQTQLHAFLSADPAHEAPSRTSQLEKALRESLEDISVKSILDFRISGTGVPAAEATATAAVCAIANIDETAPVLSIHGLDPERPWADSLEVLSKPGHFINTLRRFPQASAKGAVPEENIVAARHFLQMAQSHRDAGHPALTSLGRWLAAAVELWEAQHLEEPRKAPAAPKAAARVHVVSHKPHDFRPLQRNEVRRPVVGVNLATPRQPRLVQPSAKANSFGGRTVPLRPTSGVAPGPLDSSRPNGLSDSTRAAALRRSKSQDARQLRQSSPRPQVRERQQSPRVQRPETSPRPRQASPRPVATPQRSDRQSFCRAPVTARERPKERQPSPRPVGAVTAREDRQSLVRERPTCRDRSASRQIPSPSPKSEQLTRSQSARRSLDSRSPKTDPLNRSMSRGASQRSGTHLGLRGLVSSKSASTLARAPAATGPPNPTAELPSVEELKRMIEETKKEVREIRSVESKAKWQMTREERREKLAETVAAQSELREWRWKQAQGLKQLAAQQAQAAKVSDLKESKEFVEFKRETKLRSKEVELQHQQDVYVARKADAAWQVEQAKANVEKHQAQILEKVEDVHHLRQERRSQTENEKAVAAEERALQEHLQIANLARELAKEKERLLENLELTRACMQAPIRRR